MTIRQPKQRLRLLQKAALVGVTAATIWTSILLARLMISSSSDSDAAALHDRLGFLPPLTVPFLRERTSSGGDDDFIIDRVQEDPIPNPPLPDGQSAFAACLLVMDDNHRLVEWLAYHYYVLPLRYLIVAVDPRSSTSPTMLLNKWRRMGMYVLEWNDTNIWGDGNVPQVGPERKYLTGLHNRRQPKFYGSCTKQAKADNMTWVTMHDSDEYLVYTHKGGDGYEEWEREIDEERIKARRYYSRIPRPRPSQVPPTTAEEGAMLPYIRQEADAGWSYFNSSCILFPRLLFGGADHDNSSLKNPQQQQTTLSSVVDPDRLDTLRFRRHANPFDWDQNGNGKAMMDVSKFDHIRPRVKVHVALEDKCPKLLMNYWQNGLTVNHYLGSWEAYAFRNDSRRGGERTWEAWRFKSEANMTHTSDIITPWIGGFIQSVGTDKARDLLQGAGLPRGYQSSILSSNWNSEYLDVIMNSSQPDRFQAFVQNIHNKNNQK